MFDYAEYDKAQKALTVLRDIQENVKVNGVSRADITYALEAAEIFKLPNRYPVNSFTAEASSTNLDVALESLSEGQRLGYSILTGVIVGLLAKIISYFFTGGSSGGSGSSAPYIAKQNHTLEQFANLKKIAVLERERADEIASMGVRRKAMRKVLGDVEISEYMLQHPYTRIAFETLCSHNAKFRKCTSFLGELQKRENLRSIYVFIMQELNDSLLEMIETADAIKEWVYARRRGGNREKVIEPRLQIPGPMLDRFIARGTKSVHGWLAANNIVGPGMMIDVTPPDEYKGVPIPTEDIPLFLLIETFKFMNQMSSDPTGIKFAEPTDYLDRLITAKEKLLLRVTSSTVLEEWEPLPNATPKDYDPMDRATLLNKRVSKAYDKTEWNTLFSKPKPDGKDGDEESDWFVGESWKLVDIYFDGVQSLYKESAILLKMANDIISGMHDALRIVDKYQKELKTETKETEPAAE
jgi:hypothetical protein